MAWNLPVSERRYLRELASKQAELAAAPVMEERKRMWFDLNDGIPGARPPVIIEAGSFNRDFLPEDVFRCRSDTGKDIERQLLANIRNHELLDDDKVMPDTFNMGWFVDIDEIGVKIDYKKAKDFQGFETAIRAVNPFKDDLKKDLQLLKPAVCHVDREKTKAWKAFLDDLLGEILPVKIHTGLFGCTELTRQAVELMGMEAFFMAMYDSPDEVHQLMTFLRDNAIRVMRWAESEELLRINSGNQHSYGSSYTFTTKLPQRGCEGGPARLSDMWGYAESEETTPIAPETFHEFCFPYYRDVCELMGLLYYGCCEPVNMFWEDIRNLPHLKKVSISVLCDQPFMGDALRGTDIVFSRKPDPKFLGVDVSLDEDAWRGHIRETLEATRDVFVEFIIRDVYTMHGNLTKARRAVDLAREEIDRYRNR
jgi:hypothetical protein